MTMEEAYPKFNLTYPVVEFNSSLTSADLTESDEANSSTIPGALFGILFPHIICTLFILARTWSRFFLLRRWFLDDALTLLAWACSTAVCVIYSFGARSRLALLDEASIFRQPEQPQQPEPATKPVTSSALRVYISLVLYQLALLLTKFSILAFYHRILTANPTPTTTNPNNPPANTTRASRLPLRLTRATTLLLALLSIPLLVLTALQCHPAGAAPTGSPFFFFFSGRPLAHAARCVPFKPLLAGSAGVHGALDAWLVAALGLPCVVRLGRLLLPAGRRGAVVALVLAAAGVLGLGVARVAVGVVRVVLAVRLLGRDGDSNRSVGVFFVLTVLELDVALVSAAGAPTLGPVVAGVWPRWGLREMLGWRRERAEEGSVDLTSVVSYHGYPWTRNATPAGTPGNGRSKNPSAVGLDGHGVAVPPTPPPPVASLPVHRTPTTLSLRSFMSSMAPRSRGRLEGEDRTGLLLGEDSRGIADGTPSRRRSSFGLDDDYVQIFGLGEDEKQPSIGGGESAEAKDRWASQRYSGRWGDSQESFVLGVNDPNSPKRMSPISSLDGATKGELRRPESGDEKRALS